VFHDKDDSKTITWIEDEMRGYFTPKKYCPSKPPTYGNNILNYAQLMFSYVIGKF
jgi:hypothetical protein